MTASQPAIESPVAMMAVSLEQAAAAPPEEPPPPLKARVRESQRPVGTVSRQSPAEKALTVNGAPVTNRYKVAAGYSSWDTS